MSDVIDTLGNLGAASMGEIEKATRALKKRMKDVTNPDEYRQLDEVLQKAESRILELKESAKEMKRNSEVGKNLSNVLKNLNTSSMEELCRAAAAALEKLNKLQQNTKAYKTTAADLEKIKSRITG